MRVVITYLALAVISLITVGSAHAGSCAGKTKALGVSRVVALDTSLGQRFGRMQYKEDDLLADREVVLTFDDGPLPRYTKPILKALDDHCAKATFFYVGKMAKAYPDMIKKVSASGHTIAGHTYSHPLNLKRRPTAKAKYEIERGFMTLEAVLGHSIAPFFRFPGLSDSKPLMSYLRTRGIGMFSVDVVSNDSYTRNPERLAKQTLRKLDKLGRGILLFHDIKASTARALPNILSELKRKGYKIVHITGRTTYKPLVSDEKKLNQAIAKIPNKKWISFKQLTSDPITMPTKREAPPTNELATTSGDGASKGDVKGGDEKVDEKLTLKRKKSEGPSLAKVQKTASLTTDAADTTSEPAKPVITLPVKKPSSPAKVKGWSKKSSSSSIFKPLEFPETD